MNERTLVYGILLVVCMLFWTALLVVMTGIL